MDHLNLTDFATRYAAAWSSQNPAALASFYAENGSLTVNAGAPSVGRSAITATARSYMTAFPDMLVKMDSVSQENAHAISVGRGPGRTPVREGPARPFGLAATRSGRLVPTVSSRSRKATSMKRSTNDN